MSTYSKEIAAFNKSFYDRGEIPPRFEYSEIKTHGDLLPYEESKAIIEEAGLSLFEKIYSYNGEAEKIIGVEVINSKNYMVLLDGKLNALPCSFKFLQEQSRHKVGGFCNHKVGDYVICIANGRYKGVAFNEINKVVDIKDNRLVFNKQTNLSYDPIYFFVLKEKAVAVCLGEVSAGTDSKKNIGNHTSGDLDGINRRELVDVNPVVQRQRFVELKARKRKVVEPSLIKRKVSNK